ncbi:hypothetical protein BRE01_67330 [Brevibacillus reuszeri]|uniref:Uncharacterized protein n=1 Tax=Brevibacillus reuszeri TaxID=54915 RepID=A0A0K9YN64_9BACL|nr:hypothetical protein [Brevibacillus reuszeri]KNB70183.1 hypothetical protein ADS79_14530 [Brevibacillus reuszeri]GED73031.1 hypothetical protein BRE01_67330 [Brevibacillus reuszeri]
MSIRTEYVEVDFKLKLKKDLQENEVICPKCGGTGLQVNDHPYGLKSERGKHNEMFPYKKQTILGCSHCYSGVQTKCQFCQQLMGRSSQCKCDRYKQEQDRKRAERDLERWNKAKKITLTELVKLNNDYLYIDDWDEFYDADDLYEKVRELIEDEELTFEDIKDLRVYVTTIDRITLDAESIVENACENMHEDAYQRIDKNEIEELQESLDRFAEKIQDDTRTYYPDWGTAVVLSPEDFI